MNADKWMWLPQNALYKLVVKSHFYGEFIMLSLSKLIHLRFGCSGLMDGKMLFVDIDWVKPMFAIGKILHLFSCISMLRRHDEPLKFSYFE